MTLCPSFVRVLHLLHPRFIVLVTVLALSSSSTWGYGEKVTPERDGSLSAEEAQTVEVTAATWRAVQAKLDDVYTHAEISQLRNSAVEAFVRRMSAADLINAWEARKSARDAARHELLQDLGRLTDLRAQLDDRDAKIEAGLAVAELMLRYGNFSAAMNSAKAQLAHEVPTARKAQAFRIWVAAARGANDASQIEEAERRFKQEMPEESKSSFAPTLPFGPIRLAVRHFEYAQAQDDVALRHAATREVAEGAIKLRDKARELAAQILATRRQGP